MAVSYRFFKLQPTAIRNDTSWHTGVLQLFAAGSALSNVAYADRNGYPGAPASENVEQLDNLSLGTKFSSSGSTGLGINNFVVIDGGTVRTVEEYRWRTGFDRSQSDMVSWEVHGSDDVALATDPEAAATWVLLDEQVNYAVPTGRETWVGTGFPLDVSAAVTVWAVGGTLHVVGFAATEPTPT